jgi:hypothetical protein
MCTTLVEYDNTYLELNKLCPRPNSLYAFFEAKNLQREYSVVAPNQEKPHTTPYHTG